MPPSFTRVDCRVFFLSWQHVITQSDTFINGLCYFFRHFPITCNQEIKLCIWRARAHHRRSLHLLSHEIIHELPKCGGGGVQRKCNTQLTQGFGHSVFGSHNKIAQTKLYICDIKEKSPSKLFNINSLTLSYAHHSQTPDDIFPLCSLGLWNFTCEFLKGSIGLLSNQRSSVYHDCKQNQPKLKFQNLFDSPVLLKWKTKNAP